MLTRLPYQVPGRIFRSPLPFGPFDRTQSLWDEYRREGIDLVVVLVEKQEYLVYTGGDLVQRYRDQGWDVIHVPIPDHGLPPDRGRFIAALHQALGTAEQGRSLVAHCLAGIGRTGMFLAGLARLDQGWSGQRAVNWVREYVPGAVENAGQQRFVESLEDLDKEQEPRKP